MRWLPLGVVLLAVVLCLPAPALAQEEDAATAIAEMMMGVAGGVADGAEKQIGATVMGWTLASLGLTSDPSAEIVAALDQIEATLQQMEQELADIDELLAEEACQAATNVDAVQDAVTAIDTWVGRGTSPVNGSYLALVQEAQAGVPVTEITEDMDQLFDWVLNGNATYPPLETLLVGLDDALRDRGNAKEVITACGLLIPVPDPSTQEWDDRPYFQQLIDLVGYYAEYQARALLLVAEAYHWQALKAWIAANPSAALPPEQAPDICNAPTIPDVQDNCFKAQTAYRNVRDAMRAQYGEAGAPYSSGKPSDPDATFDFDPADPVVQIHNPSAAIWVKDIDDFFVRGGYSTSCQASTSAAPCGPGVGTYDHATFEHYGSSQALSYGANGGYTVWRPASASLWEALTHSWSGSSTSFAQLLEEQHGFTGASRPRVYFTGDVTTAEPGTSAYWEGYAGDRDPGYWVFRATRSACFVATPMTKGISSQPFCGTNIEHVMDAAKDHVGSGQPCATAMDEQHDALDDTGIVSPFFHFLYTMQKITCASPSHPDPHTWYAGPPGWLLQYEVLKNDESTGLLDVPSAQFQSQYHWPALLAAGQDGSPLECTIEPGTGEPRKETALNGRVDVPRMCGADFDGWFEKWVAPPAQVQSAPDVLTPPPIVVTVPPGSTADLAHHEITHEVHYGPVGAIDAEDGPLSARCLPETGQAFQLGTTQVRCRANDSAGASVEEVFEVRVQYPFRFVAKLDEERATRAKAGHAVPVAFDLDGDRGLDAVVPGGIRSLEIDCKTGEAFTEPEPAAGAEHLAYASRKDRYQFSWRTDPRWKGQCRALEVELADGSVHAARVDFGPHGRCQQHARHDPPGRGKHPHGKAHAPHHGKQHAGHAKPDVKHDGKHDRHHGGDAKHGKNGGRRG